MSGRTRARCAASTSPRQTTTSTRPLSCPALAVGAAATDDNTSFVASIPSMDRFTDRPYPQEHQLRFHLFTTITASAGTLLEGGGGRRAIERKGANTGNRGQSPIGSDSKR